MVAFIHRRDFLKQTAGLTFAFALTADPLAGLTQVALLYMAALFGIFIYLQLHATGNSESTLLAFRVIRDGLLYAMLAATTLSGLQYLLRAALLFNAESDRSP